MKHLIPLFTVSVVSKKLVCHTDEEMKTSIIYHECISSTIGNLKKQGGDTTWQTTKAATTMNY